MAQKDPLVEYTAEGHKMFEELSTRFARRSSSRSSTSRSSPSKPRRFAEQTTPSADTTPGMGLSYEHDSVAGADAIAAARRDGRRRGC